MRIRILDRYIFQEVAMTFAFSICAFTAVFVGSGTLFRIAEYITEYGASFASVVKIFVLSLPGVVLWTFPMSMLWATLLAFGRLSSGSEITAMLSCGISFRRLCVPGLILGFVMSLFSVWFNEYIVPWSNAAYERVLNYEIKGNTAPKTQDHIIIKDIKSGLIERLI
ncbi:MAG: LptF/LptG family permease, partial [Schwartzia sp.]|nr:LptF/LptG family permease [Schwartzia sp. (in: firmicutes)]